MEVKIIKKYNNKTVAKLLLLATKHFNSFIRKRDSLGTHFICISCGKPKPLNQMDAGHFYSAGHHPVVRFNEDNVHGQCKRCNYFLHGNLDEYRKRLLIKIGRERLKKLDGSVLISKRNGFKWDRFTLIEIIEKYK